MTTTIFDLKEKNFSIIGVNSRSKGDIYFESYVRFHAHHEGRVEMSEKSKLIIERDGSISGEISCYDLEIHGQLKGTCKSSGRVTIYPGATVSGDIQAESIIIYPGADIDIEGHTTQTIN